MPHHTVKNITGTRKKYDQEPIRTGTRISVLLRHTSIITLTD